jgi:hypothetical protein
MSTCYVLGAGFSKAVAEMPMMRDMIPAFHRIHSEAKNDGNRRLAKAGDLITGFLAQLERGNFIEPYVNENLGEVPIDTGLNNNLEHILSLIDLYLECRWQGRVQSDNRTAAVTGRGIGTRIPMPKELREAFRLYIYKTLTQKIYRHSNGKLLREFVEHIEPGDTLITFNYDLLLETALYEHGIWVPKDGYGFPLDISDEDVSEDKRIVSHVKVFKVHGSLHWRYSDAIRCFQPNIGIGLSRWYEDWTPVFPGYFRNDDPPWKQAGRDYTDSQGTHGVYGMLPSFIKHFSSHPLMEIWRMASEALRAASEVVVIGYSLPAYDSASVLLMATSGVESKTLVIVNPDSATRNHIATTTGHGNPLQYRRLEDYLGAVPGRVAD